MATIHLSPTFEIPIASESKDVLESIKSGVEKNAKIQGQFRDGHGLIWFDPTSRSFWSPWLHLDFRVRDDAKVLFGRFSPHPSVWTAFMFSYLVLSVVAFFGIILGSSQVLMSNPAWGFALVPTCLVLALILWFVSQFGERLARDEMLEMRQILDKTMQYSNDQT